MIIINNSALLTVTISLTTKLYTLLPLIFCTTITTIINSSLLLIVITS